MPDEGAAVAPLRTHTRVRHGLRRPHNWYQLIKFCTVGGSGYVVNLCVFAACVEGDTAALELEVSDGRVWSSTYPDALSRLWSALHCPRAGDVLVSAVPGHEFIDWGGADHVGGGSHGALHRGDSLGALVMCGTGPGSPSERVQWTIRDAVPVITDHFDIH